MSWTVHITLLTNNDKKSIKFLMTSSKLLKIILAILLLVVTSELAYYAYIQFSVKNNGIVIKSNKIKMGDSILDTYGSLIKSFLNNFKQEKALTVVLDVEFKGIVGNVQKDSNGITTAFSVIDDENKQIVNYELNNSIIFWKSGVNKKPERVKPEELKIGQNVHIKDRIDLLKGGRFTGVYISIL